MSDAAPSTPSTPSLLSAESTPATPSAASTPPAAPALAYQRWEYSFIIRQTERNLMADLNKIGPQGWEAISITYNKDLKGIWAWTAWLKRLLLPGVTPISEYENVVERDTTEKKQALAGFELPDGDFEFRDEPQ